MDNVEISLPMKPEYVSIARLAVSGIAGRMGFNMDEIDDIRVSISEVCNRIISTGDAAGNYKIVFNNREGRLGISFHCPGALGSGGLKFDVNEESEAGFAIMSALMDEVKCPGEGNALLSMSKSTGDHGDKC